MRDPDSWRCLASSSPHIAVRWKSQGKSTAARIEIEWDLAHGELFTAIPVAMGGARLQVGTPVASDGLPAARTRRKRLASADAVEGAVRHVTQAGRDAGSRCSSPALPAVDGGRRGMSRDRPSLPPFACNEWSSMPRWPSCARCAPRCSSASRACRWSGTHDPSNPQCAHVLARSWTAPCRHRASDSGPPDRRMAVRAPGAVAASAMPCCWRWWMRPRGADADVWLTARSRPESFYARHGFKPEAPASRRPASSTRPVAHAGRT